MELLREILFTSSHHFKDTASSGMRQDWNYGMEHPELLQPTQKPHLVQPCRTNGEEPREGHTWGRMVSESGHTSICRRAKRAKPQFELNPTDGSCTRALYSTIISISRTPFSSCYLPNASLVTL